MTGFYTHRKTVKLRSKIGTDANWVVPRLWAYAAENQPDGDLSGYTSEEIAEVIGCHKHAPSMLQALKDCGFVDENGMIHDWAEHNRYHKMFSIRAKIAAEARWAKTPPTPPKDTGNGTVDSGQGSKHDPSIGQACAKHAPSILPTESEAITSTMTAGILEDFTRYVYADWSSRSGKDAGGVQVEFLPYVLKRWSREQVEWKAKTHKGNSANENSKNRSRTSSRKTPTAAEHAAGW